MTGRHMFSSSGKTASLHVGGLHLEVPEACQQRRAVGLRPFDARHLRRRRRLQGPDERHDLVVAGAHAGAQLARQLGLDFLITGQRTKPVIS